MPTKSNSSFTSLIYNIIILLPLLHLFFAFSNQFFIHNSHVLFNSFWPQNNSSLIRLYSNDSFAWRLLILIILWFGSEIKRPNSNHISDPAAQLSALFKYINQNPVAVQKTQQITQNKSSTSKYINSDLVVRLLNQAEIELKWSAIAIPCRNFN